MQEGTRGVMFETVIKIAQPTADLEIPMDADNLDGLNYLKGKTFHEVNQTALTGVLDAHVNSGKMPNIVLEFEKMDGFMFGYLVYLCFLLVRILSKFVVRCYYFLMILV